MRKESLIHKILRKLGFIKDIEDDREMKMEMCRNEYCKFYSVSGGTNAFTGATIQPGVFTYPKMFRFPADEEI